MLAPVDGLAGVHELKVSLLTPQSREAQTKLAARYASGLRLVCQIGSNGPNIIIAAPILLGGVQDEWSAVTCSR